MATHKRKCKVVKGAFHDSNIQYFGETVVIWNIREFMNVTKWREDAIRRSKRKVEGGSAGGVGVGRGKKRGRNNNDDSSDGVDAAMTVTTPLSKKPKLSRRKKFTEVCQVLLENSLK